LYAIFRHQVTTVREEDAMLFQPQLIEILLVEDNEGDIELTREAFQESKIRNNIHVAKDGQAALDFIYRKSHYEYAVQPDVVLLDINLPKKDGKDVLKIIKNDVGLKHIPIVILTSSEAEKDIIKSYQLHANCYISKPVTLDSFMEVIRSVEEFWLGVVKLPITHKKVA
jgi:chemotaxis family two-component system response regulator Rcp1